MIRPAAALCLAGLAGCASSSAATPGFKRVGVADAVDPITATDIYRPAVGQWAYLVTAGAGHGTFTIRRRSPTERYGARWVDDIGSRRSEYWRAEANDDLVLVAVVDHEDHAVTFFDPPMVMAPAELVPGRPYEQQVNMRVMDERHEDRQRDDGTAVRRMEYVDNQVLEVPLGRLTTRHIEVRFEATLRMATAETSNSMYVHPSRGIVVDRRQEAVSVLKLPVRGGSQTLVLQTSLMAPAAP